MNWADCLNGFYEFLGGLLILNHCRVAMKDKAVAGVSITSIIVFQTWGLWNLYYYPSLNQWVSFFGGIVITSANLFWICLLLKYRKNK